MRKPSKFAKIVASVAAVVVIAGGAIAIASNSGTSSGTNIVVPVGRPTILTAAGDLGGSVNEISPVANIIKAINPDVVAIPGDLVYPDGASSGFNGFFNTVYGPLKSKILAAPGNHDYHQSGGSGFYGYFTGQNKGLVSVDIGNNWRLEIINTEESVSAGSAAEVALKADLAANAGKHFIAITHHPRYTNGSSHGPMSGLDAMWKDLDDAKADVFIAGHNHQYERFQPMGPGSALKAEGQGIRQFVAGSGGNGLYSFKQGQSPGSQYQDGTHWGAVKFTLEDTQFCWEFDTTTNQRLDIGCAPTRTGGVVPTTTTTTIPPTTTTTNPGTTTTTTVPPTTTTTIPPVNTVDVQPGDNARCVNGTFTNIDNSHVKCVGTIVTTTTTIPPTTTTTSPPNTGCGLPPAWKSYSGAQSSTTRPGTIPAGRWVNAVGASWAGTTTYPVTFAGGLQSCWIGGAFTGTWNQATTPWSTYHGTGAINCKGGCDNVTIKDAWVYNYGDSYRFEGNSPHWVLDHVSALNGHDDSVENDWNNSGTVVNSRLSSYVSYSARAGSGQGGNGSSNIVHLRKNLIRLQPTATVYKGTSPGTGGWFKLDANSPRMTLRDNIFRADLVPNHQDLLPPPTNKLDTCVGNVVLWGNTAVPFPAAARSAWTAQCPGTTIVEGQAAIDLWNYSEFNWETGA